MLVTEIADYEIFPINGSETKDLSGLASCNGDILTVSDKDNRNIYRLDEDEDVYHLVKHREIPSVQKIEIDYSIKHRMESIIDKSLHDDPLDFEGITCSEQGSIFIASENHLSILEYMGSSQAIWLIESLYPAGRDLGYFGTYNAFLEGITFHKNRFRLAVERQQRGIIDIHMTVKGDIESIAFRKIPNNLNLDFHGRSKDVAGLTENQSYIFTLERNASAICRRENNSYESVDCITFLDAENSIQYDDIRYGKSEGLVIFNNYVYIVFDNNGVSIKGIEDRRGRLVRFPLPKDWA